jgi:hypothetical protein
MKEDRTELEGPPRIDSRRSWPWPLVLALGSLVVLVLALLFLFDPARHAFYPVCLFKKTTGYDCPGCGGLRSVHQLLRGDIWQAFQLNAMVVVALPLFAVGALIRGVIVARGVPRRARGFWVGAWLLVAGIVVFGVLRNLPLWPFGVTAM